MRFYTAYVHVYAGGKGVRITSVGWFYDK